MSTFIEYMEEIELIDHYIEQGYKITFIDEHMDGATVTWIKSDAQEGDRTMLLKTADARKYLGEVLIKQLAME